MNAAKARATSVQRLMAVRLGGFGRRRRVGGVLSAWRNAPAPGASNRGHGCAGDSDCGRPARQPGLHGLSPRPHFCGALGRRGRAAGRLVGTPADPTGAAVAQAAGLAGGTCAIR
jgi:hypothetical protein